MNYQSAIVKKNYLNEVGELINSSRNETLKSSIRIQDLLVIYNPYVILEILVIVIFIIIALV